MLQTDDAQIVAGHHRGTALLRRLKEAGFIREGISVDPEQVLGYLAPFLEPLREPEFTFTREWLRGVGARINDPRNPNWIVGTKLNLPPDYLLIHRVWLGGIGVLCQIGGRVPGRSLAEQHIPGADFPVLETAAESDDGEDFI